MAEFPIILMPDAIKQTKTVQPSVRNFDLPVPKHPGNPPEKVNPISLSVKVAIAIVLSPFIGYVISSSLLGMLLLVVSLGIVGFQTWQQFNNYSQKKKKHQQQVTIYRKEQEKYENQKCLHYEQAQAEQTPEKVAEFQYELLLNTLSRAIPHDGNNSKAPIGYTEKYFCSYLKRYFSNNVYTGLTLDIPNFSHPYSPDFAYIDSNLNLYVDIEIDEPYAYKSRVSTHYIYAEKDERRNNFFLDRGWLVIRFSEEQIVKYPESCCKTVAEIIAYLLNDNSILSPFQNVIPLPKRKQWTREEAEKMAMAEYRKTYL